MLVKCEDTHDKRAGFYVSFIIEAFICDFVEAVYVEQRLLIQARLSGSSDV
jgi:hypothetical protein